LLAGPGDGECATEEIVLDDGRRCLGYVVCCGPTPSGEDTSRVRAAVESVAAVVHGLYTAEAEATAAIDELTATYEELAVVYEIAQVAAALPRGPSLVRWCLERTAESMQLRSGCFLLRQFDGAMRVAAAFGMPAAQLDALPGAASTALADPAARLVSRAVVITDRSEIEAAEPSWRPWVAALRGACPLPWMAAPVRSSGQLMGLVVGHRPAAQRAFSSRDLKLLHATARQVGLALRNSSLADELAHLFLATVRGLAAAIDAKDPYTRGHSDRVAHLAALVCEQMELPTREQQDLILASLLHDVGKIGVPESVLRKPGTLGEDEWCAIREHPDRGAAIVSEVRQLRRLVPGIRHHHERFGGGGYPQGMVGHEIPLAARIIGACDAYDAMTSARPYRLPRPPPEAVAELRRCSGSQFDPSVVSALIERLEGGPTPTRLGDPTAFLGVVHTAAL
jgi:HD-GYP domain-containing protein (c-di-GMP phosphodiesterase class II)